MNITEFQKSRFGLFIHWGIYSIPARGEWVRSNEEMKEEDYIPFANEFDPDLFDPHQWAKLAKAAGMKYAVMTAKPTMDIVCLIQRLQIGRHPEIMSENF